MFSSPFRPPAPSWHETWFPLNAGTLPGWVLVFLWSIGVCWWFARPFKRPLLLHLGYFLMMFFCAAIFWSFSHRVVTPPVGPMPKRIVYNDPTFVTDQVLRAAAQAVGLISLFTVMIVTSGILFLANLELSSTSYRSSSDDAPPDEPK